MQNYFELFRLPQQFEIDTSVLDTNYRKLLAEVHPDKFVNTSAAEKMQSMQQATSANEAYQTLKQPTARARYLMRKTIPPCRLTSSWHRWNGVKR